MDVGLFERVIAEVAPHTEMVCFHLMGDPLVHPHLESLVGICARAGVSIFLVTNGLLLKEKTAELLLHPSFRQVNFSLHAYGDNFGDKDPTTYLERIFNFTDSALTRRPELYMNYRLWNLQEPRGGQPQNLGMLERIRARFGGEAIDRVDVRERKSVRIRGRLYLHFDTQFVWPDLSLPVLGTKGTCYGLDSHVGVLADGTVVPCCLDKEGKIPLGNLASESFESILRGPRATAMERGFRERRLVESLCQRCQYIERFGA